MMGDCSPGHASPSVVGSRRAVGAPPIPRSAYGDNASLAAHTQQSGAAAASAFAATRARAQLAATRHGRSESRGSLGGLSSDSSDFEDDVRPWVVVYACAAVGGACARLTQLRVHRPQDDVPAFDANGLRRPLSPDHDRGKHSYMAALGALRLAAGDAVGSAAVDSALAAAAVSSNAVSHFVDGLDREHVNLRHQVRRACVLELLCNLLACAQRVQYRREWGVQGINEMAAAAIAQCLAVNTTIRSLDVGDNCLGDAGSAVLIGAVASNGHIESLDISGNGAGRTAAATLAKALQGGSNLRALMLGRNPIGNPLIPRLLHSLPFSPALRVLDLSSNAIPSR